MIKDLWKFVRERPRVLTGMIGEGDDGEWGWMGMSLDRDGDKCPSPCSSLMCDCAITFICIL